MGNLPCRSVNALVIVKANGGLLSFFDDPSGEAAGSRMLLSSGSIVSCRLVTFCSPQTDVHGLALVGSHEKTPQPQQRWTRHIYLLGSWFGGCWLTQPALHAIRPVNRCLSCIVFKLNREVWIGIPNGWGRHILDASLEIGSEWTSASSFPPLIADDMLSLFIYSSVKWESHRMMKSKGKAPLKVFEINVCSRVKTPRSILRSKESELMTRKEWMNFLVSYW